MPDARNARVLFHWDEYEDEDITGLLADPDSEPNQLRRAFLAHIVDGLHRFGGWSGLLITIEIPCRERTGEGKDVYSWPLGATGTERFRPRPEA